MNAYNELYLDDAMANLGDMVEYAVCTLGYAPDDFFGWFISSGIASKFENGNPKYVAPQLSPLTAAPSTGPDGSLPITSGKQTDASAIW